MNCVFDNSRIVLLTIQELSFHRTGNEVLYIDQVRFPKSLSLAFYQTAFLFQLTVLFTEDCFWNVSTDAKLLYGILLDRMNLSARNGWLDEEGRVYIIFTIEEIKGALGCAEKKAVKLHLWNTVECEHLRLLPIEIIIRHSSSPPLSAGNTLFSEGFCGKSYPSVCTDI